MKIHDVKVGIEKSQSYFLYRVLHVHVQTRQILLPVESTTAQPIYNVRLGEERHRESEVSFPRTQRSATARARTQDCSIQSPARQPIKGP